MKSVLCALNLVEAEGRRSEKDVYGLLLMKEMRSEKKQRVGSRKRVELRTRTRTSSKKGFKRVCSEGGKRSNSVPLMAKRFWGVIHDFGFIRIQKTGNTKQVC